jgi:hypothetical protein
MNFLQAVSYEREFDDNREVDNIKQSEIHVDSVLEKEVMREKLLEFQNLGNTLNCNLDSCLIQMCAMQMSIFTSTADLIDFDLVLSGSRTNLRRQIIQTDPYYDEDLFEMTMVTSETLSETIGSNDSTKSLSETQLSCICKPKSSFLDVKKFSVFSLKSFLNKINSEKDQYPPNEVDFCKR